MGCARAVTHFYYNGKQSVIGGGEDFDVLFEKGIFLMHCSLYHDSQKWAAKIDNVRLKRSNDIEHLFYE